MCLQWILQNFVELNSKKINNKQTTFTSTFEVIFHSISKFPWLWGVCPLCPSVLLTDRQTDGWRSKLKSHINMTYITATLHTHRSLLSFAKSCYFTQLVWLTIAINFSVVIIDQISNRVPWLLSRGLIKPASWFPFPATSTFITSSDPLRTH